MMIDFALVAERTQGLTPEDAIKQASLLRFRPIMMTTMAAILGALPMALGSGAGAELRRPLGIAIVGGLLRQPGAVALHDAGLVRVHGSTPASDRPAPGACATKRRRNLDGVNGGLR